MGDSMKRILFSLCVISLCASQQLNTAQHITIRPTNQQEQIPSQEEIKEFFDAARVESYNKAENQKKHREVFYLIQKYGINIINARKDGSPRGDSVLLIAADNVWGWTAEEFEKLLQVPGVDKNIVGSADTTPLKNAMFTGLHKDPNSEQLQKISLLIKYGADINLPNSNGSTPLMQAARDNQPKVVALLLDAGASTDGVITAGAYRGKTFFDFAKEHSAVQQVYDHYKKEISAHITEHLSGIKDLGNIVSGYLFTPESDAAIKQKLIDTEEKHAAAHRPDFGLPVRPHFQTGSPERERFFRQEYEEQQPTLWERVKSFWSADKK